VRARARITAQLGQSASGRPEVKIGNDPKLSALYMCGDPDLGVPTKTEKAALDALDRLVDACVAPVKLGPVDLNLDFSWVQGGGNDAASAQTIETCIDSARREQLRPYVAPAALLFVADPQGTAAPAFRLTSADTARIVGVTALVCC